VQKATTVVDEQIPKVINLVAKSSIPTAQLSIDKDIDIIRTVTSPHMLEMRRKFCMSSTISRHSIEGSTSLESARRLPKVGSPSIIPRFTRTWSAHAIARPLPLFAPNSVPRALS